MKSLLTVDSSGEASVSRYLRKVIALANSIRGPSPLDSMQDVTIGRNIEAKREAWVLEQLRGLPSGVRVLDAGAGQQRYRKPAEAMGLEYIAQDFGKYDGTGDGSGLQTGSWNYGDLDIISDITEIPVSDASFDAVLCVSVLEHIPDPISALKEFSRILRAGGSLILTAPAQSFVHFAPYFFCSGFSKFFYNRYLPEAGLSIVKQDFNGSLFEYLAMIIRQLPAHGNKYSGLTLSRNEEYAMVTILKALQRAENTDSGSWEFCAADVMLVANKV